MSEEKLYLTRRSNTHRTYTDSTLEAWKEVMEAIIDYHYLHRGFGYPSRIEFTVRVENMDFYIEALCYE